MYNDGTYFYHDPDRPIRGVFGEAVEVRHYPSLIGAAPRIVVEVSEHDDLITAHIDLEQARRLLVWLWDAVIAAEDAS